MCLALILTAAATLMCLSSCDREQKFKIGVSLFHKYSWREKLCDEMRYTSFKYSNVVLDIASAENDGARQARQIKKMIDNGINLIIVSPIPDPRVTAILDKAYDRGIPIIAVDNRQVIKRYTAYIGADNNKIGEQVADYVSEILNNKGNIVEIMGKKGDIPTIERSSSFLRVLKKHPDMHIVGSEYCNWRYQEAIPCLERLFNENKKVDLVFFHSDGMVPDISIISKLREKNPQLKLVSIDALSKEPFGLQKIKDGILTASFVYPTRGDMVLDLAINILKGKQYARETILPTGVVDSSNLQTILQQYIEINGLDSQISQMQEDMKIMYNSRKQQRMAVWMLCIIIITIFSALIISYIQLKKIRRLKASLHIQLDKQKEQTLMLKENNIALKNKNQRIAREAEIKMNFFTNISHEIRTPLTLVMGPVEELMNVSTLSDRQKKNLLTLASHNLSLLHELVNEVLDLQKLQNRMMKLKLVHFDLAKAINDWAENFRHMEIERQVTLSIPSSVHPIWIEADRIKMTSIFVNLVGNAFKFTKPGGIIRVTVNVDKSNPSELQFCVSDNGRGIKKIDLPHIFDTFYQSSDTRGGTGIGLSVTKSFVEMHHGTITVQSTEGAGTTFEITMPLRQTKIETCMRAEPEEIDTETRNEDKDTRPKILIIDDNTEMRNYIRLILGDKYVTVEACNGLEGYEKAQSTVPDVIICDVMMPVMDGQEFCSKLKSTISVSHIPVILLTARSLDEHKTEGYESGADSYITKPFQARLLLSRIENLLENRILLRNIFGNDMDNRYIHNDKPKEMEFLRRFRDYIKENMSDQTLSVELMAQHMCISRAQLYSKIKSFTGMSPIEQLKAARLIKAKELLITTDIQVSNIGYDVGFTSPSYFTKCFREKYGMTPNEYRAKQTRQNVITQNEQ